MKLPIYHCELTFTAKSKRKYITRTFDTSMVLDKNHHQLHDKKSQIQKYCLKYLVTPSKGLDFVLKHYEISLTFKKLNYLGKTVWEAQEENEELNKDS